MKQGVIFDSNKSDLRAVGVGSRIVWLRRIAKLVSRFGSGLMCGAIILIILWFWPVVREEVKYSFGQTLAGKVVERVANTKVIDVVKITEPSQSLRPSWIVPDENYSIYIPKILAKSVVLPDIDPYDRSAYQTALLKGVAAAKNMAYPGQLGSVYLFAHSVGAQADWARYNAIFYLLHKLEKGDDIEIFYKNKLYKYQVFEKKIIPATDTSYLEPQFDTEKLILQTCYPPGTSWKRLIIEAVPVGR